MRILYIITRGDAVGGASIHVRDMSARLIEDGHAVHVLVGQGAPVAEILSKKGIPFTQVNSMVRALQPHKDICALIQIAAFMTNWKPDLVSTHTSKAGALGRIAAQILGIPVLYTPHCWSFADNFPRAALYLKIERLLAWSTTRCVAVSEYERQLGILNDTCQLGNSLTIHNGMPDHVSVPRAIPEKSPPQLVMVARLDQQKDHLNLIRALGQLKDLPWQLSLIGDGPLKEDIQALVDQQQLAERVKFTGYSDSVATELAKMQIFILSTHWESFPRSILEAMRAGLPILTSDVGGCSESVAHGHNGFIFTDNQPENMAKEIRKLLSDKNLRKQTGRASRERFDHEFTFDHMYQKYLELYQATILGG